MGSSSAAEPLGGLAPWSCGEDLPSKPRAMGLVMEWATLHRDDLNRVWEQAMAHEPLDSIPPLE